MPVEVLRELVRQYLEMSWAGSPANDADAVSVRSQAAATQPAAASGSGEPSHSSGGPAAFCWQGGEPTLMGVDFYRTVIALQKKHGRSGQVVANSLQTNGVLLDDEWARLLARYRFLVGLSLDGPAEVHDHYRTSLGGQPTLARVLRGLKTLQRQGVECNALAW